jgi:hypothetical protein
MQRKIEQGSTQRQGEIQELAIEEWLKNKFPLDSISEVKKGQKGGDCLQTVHTRSHQNCGTIYYESKRTKEFGYSWIEKFKADMRDKKVDIGVIVTETLPKEMDRFGIKDGVWICTYEEFKGLCSILRETLLRVHQVTLNNENKGTKEEMIYNFVVSNEFKMRIEAIVEGWVQMQKDLQQEKRAMEGMWKKREVQIEKVLLNTNMMFSSIKGIAGSEVGSIKALELPSE